MTVKLHYQNYNFSLNNGLQLYAGEWVMTLGGWSNSTAMTSLFPTTWAARDTRRRQQRVVTSVFRHDQYRNKIQWKWHNQNK